MTTEIQIINGLARLVETKVVGEMPLAELAPYLEYRKPVTMPIMPDNVTFITFDEQNGRGILLVERPPTVTGLSCHFDPGNRFPAKDREQVKKPDDDWHTFTISIPWQYHLYGFSVGAALAGAGIRANFRIDQTGYYWAKQQIQTLDDEIQAAAMLNINPASNICWGSTQAPTDTLKNRINGQVKNFLATHFNTHYGWFIPPAYKSYTDWEAASKADPMCWQKTAWDSYWDKTNQIGMKYARTTPRTLAQTYDRDVTTQAALGVAEWGVPNPPPVFTVAKAVEWFERMQDDDRRRFAYALNQVSQNITGEPATEGAGMARITNG